jgi:hypothetical protein
MMFVLGGKYKHLLSGTFLLYYFFVQSVYAQNVIPRLQRDDYEKKRAWWWFHNEGYGGNPQDEPAANNGYLIYILDSPQINGSSSSWLDDGANVSIETAGVNWLYPGSDNVFLRQRVKLQSVHMPGSRGWGFWFNEYPSIYSSEVVWYMQLREEEGHPWTAQDTWWRASITKGNLISGVRHAELSSSYLTGWHVYQVNRYGQTRIDVLIDGVIVLTSSSNLPALAYEYNQWVDNVIYHVRLTGGDTFTIDNYYRAWSGQNIMLTDYVEIVHGTDPVGYSVAPSGIIRLREYPNEIAFGYSNYLWKNYTFQSVGGHNLIIVTAKAEEYDSYDNPDLMRISLDGNDFGFGGTNGWDGTVQQAAPKTVVLDRVLPAGSHNLRIYSSVTPILYDVTVLNSLYGSVILNQSPELTAPTGSAGQEWQNFNFRTTNAGEVGIYVTAIADENPGWAHITGTNVFDSQDDDLRMALYRGSTLIKDYGWQTDQSWYGNKLFGEIKSILVKETLAADTYTLKFYANNTPTLKQVLIYGEFEDSSLPVGLSSFTVINTESGNMINWLTSSEVENLGFNIYRAEADEENSRPDEQEFIKINEMLIPGAGNSSDANHYQYIDHLVIPQRTYWYFLEDVAYDGQINRYDMISVQTDRMHVRAYHLFQNYPNPFNSQTRISFSLQENGPVQIIIYTITGQEIRILIDDDLQAGTHTIVWDGKDRKGITVGSGLYYYRLVAKDQTRSRKMLLIK